MGGLAHAKWGCVQVLAELERLCTLHCTLPADNGAWADRAECMICMAAPRCTRLRPCCHALLCVACAADLILRGDSCPTCRAAVDRYEEGAFQSTFAPV